MMIQKKKILESGLLELYVIGNLDKTKMEVVDKAVGQYPELKRELVQIEKTLYLVAKTTAIAPPNLKSLKRNLIKMKISSSRQASSD